VDAQEEVVVSLDGRPRPAVVVGREDDRVLVRYRHAGSFEEQWVRAADVVAVETRTERPPLGKLVGIGLVALLGLALLLYPSGSDRPLIEGSPTPSPSATPSATPAAVTAVLLGDSFTAGKNDPPGTRTALEVAARTLGWRYVVKAQQATGWTTSPSYGERLAREVTTAPTVLVLQGGASDTEASAGALTQAVLTTVTAVKKRFPGTTVVLVGPVAMEQPPDPALVRVGRTLAAAAAALRVTYVDPAPWITRANAEKYLAAQGFYPNPAGHAYLGARLAAALKGVV
jgi:hypothetical protein